MKKSDSLSNTQSGFTLVELALIVMIIGLMIGGILRGQEMYHNAQLNSVITGIESYKAATNSFMTLYKAYPGDIADPADTIPNCTMTPCNIGGNQNGIVDNNEQLAFWGQLSAAGMIPGIKMINSTEIYPKLYTTQIYFTGSSGFPAFMMLTSGSNFALKPEDAAYIDRKMDDGLVNAGYVTGVSTGGASCYVPSDQANYNIHSDVKACALTFKLK